MKWSERTQTQKGAVGERIVVRHLEARGLNVYQPITDGAHLFDFLCANKKAQRLVAAEVKTKPRRQFYPDTGINVSHCKGYMAVQARYGIEVFIYFVDEIERRIYGNKLTGLLAPKQIEHNGKTLSYPLQQGEVVYFPLCSMIDVASLDEDEQRAISELSTRNPAYDYNLTLPFGAAI